MTTNEATTTTTTTTTAAAAQQRAELHKKIWAIADEVRGAVDGWDFKQYVLGMLFYQFISTNICRSVDAINREAAERSGQPETFRPYESMTSAEDEQLIAYGKAEIMRMLGYFIAPQHLFNNIRRHADTDSLNERLSAAFAAIEAQIAHSEASAAQFRGLFVDIDVTSPKLGATAPERNRRLRQLLDGIASINASSINDYHIDVFGDAYEFLISNYASNAGKSGGEFFTPQSVSQLLARLVTDGREGQITSVYDPTCGSGSLLLQVARASACSRGQISGSSANFALDDLRDLSTREICSQPQNLPHDSGAAANFADAATSPDAAENPGLSASKIDFYGQEINLTTYNLARMNMLLHEVNYSHFLLARGDTLLEPDERISQRARELGGFSAIVSNPPYSIKWPSSDNPTLINDHRFAPAGALAPKSAADWAFIMHALSLLAPGARAAVVCFPGIFYRKGAEGKIRRYLCEQGYIKAIIALGENLFFGTNIATYVAVFSREASDRSVLFIDASEQYVKEINNNSLSPANIDAIVAAVRARSDAEHFAHLASFEEIAANGFNLSVSNYVAKKDLREQIDIAALEADIAAVMREGEQLRGQIAALKSELAR